MEKQFNITINAPREKVWKTLWDDTTYPKWTTAFCEGSKAITDWQEGSKVLFVDGENRGMVSVIERKIPNEYMSFKMLGELVKGEVDYTTDNALLIAGGFENYTLTEQEGTTLLVIDIGGANMTEGIIDYFMATWPKALALLKALAEE
ncbi:SRPBCC domain-containing protein [Mucilaginibacter phyllosphaerae]